MSFFSFLICTLRESEIKFNEFRVNCSVIINCIQCTIHTYTHARIHWNLAVSSATWQVWSHRHMNMTQMRCDQRSAQKSPPHIRTHTRHNTQQTLIHNTNSIHFQLVSLRENDWCHHSLFNTVSFVWILLAHSRKIIPIREAQCASGT